MRNVCDSNSLVASGEPESGTKDAAILSRFDWCRAFQHLKFLNSFSSPHFSTDTGLSMPSDTSLSPASQNSPYCMTPVSQGSPASSGIGSPMASSTITKIHSKRFRE